VYCMLCAYTTYSTHSAIKKRCGCVFSKLLFVNSKIVHFLVLPVCGESEAECLNSYELRLAGVQLTDYLGLPILSKPYKVTFAISQLFLIWTECL